jgi:hypothetical protein
MTVDFKKGLQSLRKEAIKRHPEPVEEPQRTGTRKGRVTLTQWVDPAVRKQLQQLSLDHEKDQYELVNEALNLMFEKYGKAPIA